MDIPNINYDELTLQDCDELYKFKNTYTEISNGQVVGFYKEVSE